jgi:hypothetical protein
MQLLDKIREMKVETKEPARPPKVAAVPDLYRVR